MDGGIVEAIYGEYVVLSENSDVMVGGRHWLGGNNSAAGKLKLRIQNRTIHNTSYLQYSILAGKKT